MRWAAHPILTRRENRRRRLAFINNSVLVGSALLGVTFFHFGLIFLAITLVCLFLEIPILLGMFDGLLAWGDRRNRR